MKYITSIHNDIFVFSKGITHSEMANKNKIIVRGAGFVDWEKRICYGESISLGISCHEKDTDTLDYHLSN